MGGRSADSMRNGLEKDEEEIILEVLRAAPNMCISGREDWIPRKFGLSDKREHKSPLDPVLTRMKNKGLIKYRLDWRKNGTMCFITLVQETDSGSEESSPTPTPGSRRKSRKRRRKS